MCQEKYLSCVFSKLVSRKRPAIVLEGCGGGGGGGMTVGLLFLLFVTSAQSISVWDSGIVWHSQIDQDKYVMQQVYGDSVPLGKGYFVEIGAADGVHMSNALTLEEAFGWTGLCVEPSRQYARLVTSGRRCAKRNEPLSNVSGIVVDFFEDVQNSSVDTQVTANRLKADNNDEMTIVANPSSRNLYSGIREHLLYSTRGEVTRRVTRTLEEVMDEHQAPSFVHFLSLDTEGTEFMILQNFNFSKYTFGAVAVEHNQQGEKREQIRLLLTAHGYVRTFCVEMDDIYVHASLVLARGIFVDPRMCDTKLLRLKCPQPEANKQILVQACLAYKGLDENACRQLQERMLSKSHECGKMSLSERSLLEVVVPVLLNQDFYFKVGLEDKTDKVVIPLGPSSNLETVTAEFCTKHALSSEQCERLLVELEKFIRQSLQIETQKSILEVVRYMKKKGMCAHSLSILDRSAVDPNNSQAAFLEGCNRLAAHASELKRITFV